jgi:outer membrane protein OmpA-like peptidoglycan-associated protein/tetratricopeptide (TPR) repeat protein
MCRYCFLFFSGLLLFFPAQAQEKLPSVPPRATKGYEKAKIAIKAGDLDKAAKLLVSALAVAPDYPDARVQLAYIHYDQGRIEEALLGYKRVLAQHPSWKPVLWYQAAQACAKLSRFEEAVPMLETFLSLDHKSERQVQAAEVLLKQSRFAASAMRNPVPFQPRTLGPAINTELPEYLPSLSADASLLVFTRVVNGQEDFYTSTWSEGWQAAQALTELNTRMNEGAHCLSANGRVLVFTACNYPDGMGSCDLYISQRENKSWTRPLNIGAPVNTDGYETQPSLSADGNMLLFTSTRPGGYGKNDLWQSIRQPNGRWGAPQNLGPLINTPEDDQAPFLHPDGQTLYFMSKGHPGLGSFDLYLSRRDSLGQWQQPINLGYPINTPAHEGAIVVSTDGRQAFYTKEQGPAGIPGFPRTDIYTFDLYPEARPLPVTYAKGIVRDASTRQPLQADVEIRIPGRETVLLRTQSAEDGAFLVCLPIGKTYALHVQRKGYVFFSENFDLSNTADSLRAYVLTPELQPLQARTISVDTASAPIVLRNVFFASGSAELLPASVEELQRLQRLLRDNPDMRIQINGHTDDVGEEKANQLLSEQRAKAVRDYLVAQGIEISRLAYRGFGESMPIAPNDSAENQQRNRRTEFVRLLL